MKSISDKEFQAYGVKLSGDFSSAIEYLEKKTFMPTRETNFYVADDKVFDKLDIIKTIQKEIYGELPIEAGYCNGYNSYLNCLEAHACPEVNIAATDMVLILALLKDIHNDKIDSKDTVSFMVHKGEAIMLYPYTFHFSPCKVTKEGFKCAVILTEGTNEPLENPIHDKHLFKKNKWLYAFPETKQADLGAYVGLIGENIKIPCP